MIRIGLHPKAGLDLSAVTRYYRGEAGRDVAERFITEFWRCVEFLLEHPEGAPAFGPEGVRRKVPYAYSGADLFTVTHPTNNDLGSLPVATYGSHDGTGRPRRPRFEEHDRRAGAPGVLRPGGEKAPDAQRRESRRER